MERPTKEEIEKFVIESINPGLQMHGGYLMIDNYEESTGVLSVSLGGGCHGCASSTITLKLMIDNAMKEQFPGLSEIIDVTDHTSGQNPYY
jgi:Fe/S biogenesis protein NfuA